MNEDATDCLTGLSSGEKPVMPTAIARSLVQTRSFVFLLVMLSLATLMVNCSKGNKQGTKQTVDQAVPEKIRRLVPTYVKDCGPCPGILLQYDWKGDTIYVRTCNGPTCDCFGQLYNKNGDSIKYDLSLYQAFNKESKMVKVIWKCQ